MQRRDLETTIPDMRFNPEVVLGMDISSCSRYNASVDASDTSGQKRTRRKHVRKPVLVLSERSFRISDVKRRKGGNRGAGAGLPH